MTGLYDQGVNYVGNLLLLSPGKVPGFTQYTTQSAAWSRCDFRNLAFTEQIPN